MDTECYSIAPGDDGGENNLTFEPLNLEIIRVVDSEGNRKTPEDYTYYDRSEFSIGDLFEEIEVLKRFLSELNIEYEDLSYFLPITNGNGERNNFKSLIRHLRDILEWAVLLDMAWDPQKTPILLLRDGLCV